MSNTLKLNADEPGALGSMTAGPISAVISVGKDGIGGKKPTITLTSGETSKPSYAAGSTLTAFGSFPEAKS